MKRVGGWLTTPKTASSASKSLTAIDEPAALHEALHAAAKIMNDEVEEAEAELSKGTSPFHKLGRSTAVFLRATLGFEKDTIAAATTLIADAEESSLEFQRRAIRDPTSSHQSKIYPVGAEYALCHAESQLMSAVLAVLNESLMESLRGFQKLRKAFTTLSEIHEAEKRYIAKHTGDKSLVTSGSSSRTELNPMSAGETVTPSETSGVITPIEEAEFDFIDAAEDRGEGITPMEYQGHFELLDMKRLTLEKTLSTRALAGVAEEQDTQKSEVHADVTPEDDFDMRTLTDDPIDLFIHSGTALCFGLLQLLLSMIPPAFSRVLSLFSFRGDREAGIRMLWTATRYKNDINGALAGLITLSFHSGAIGLCDILTPEAYPQARLKALLKDMRALYPKSKLWLLEEARMLGSEQQLRKSLALLNDSGKSNLKQIEAFCTFERSLNYLFLHEYEACAKSFMECMKLNNWSHGLYYYIAGACYVELYRITKETNSTSKEAMIYRERAKEYFEKVPEASGKKKFMARQLPVDVFVLRKIAKWEARRKARGGDLIDAVGVSPIAEMTYFWSGYKRMGKAELDRTLERLAWSEQQVTWRDEVVDEKALLSTLKGICLRFLGRIAEAEDELTTGVLRIAPAQMKACDHAESWPLPVAHYELAVCHWREAGGQHGDSSLLAKCNEELIKVEKWDSTYDLEARVGMKLTTAGDTMRRCGLR